MANLKDLIVNGVGRILGDLSVGGTVTGTFVNYGVCSTAAATAAKTVTIPGSFTLATGAEVTVKFSVTNTAASPTLNVNGTGAKPVYYRGAAITASYLAENRTYSFRYNGAQWELVGGLQPDGALPIANGGTGLTSSPSMLTNLESTSAVNVLQASPRPGVTGTLPIANGGTGQTTLSNLKSSLGVSRKTYTPTWESGEQPNRYNCFVVTGVCYLHYVGPSNTHSANTVLFTLPSGCCPTAMTYLPFVKGSVAYGTISVSTDGTVKINAISSTSAKGSICFNGTFGVSM